jgi:uncharacterized protein involved in response to NO
LCQVVLVMLWWGLELLERSGLGSWPSTINPTRVHLYLMVYGVFPFFILGFLFTVYPRWMNTAVVPRAHYLAVSALLGAALPLFYLGLWLAAPLTLLAATIELLAWIGAIVVLLQVYRRAPRRGVHETWINVALAAGALGMAAWMVGVARNDAVYFDLARELGLWLFLLPVVFLVGHRMIPFFSQSVLLDYLMVRPAWSPPLVLACAAAHVAFELGGLPQWRFLADVPLAVAALHHSWVWQFRRSFHARLLAMLHIAFLWLGLAMTLYAVQSLVLLAGGAEILGRAPLHALGIGFLTGMVVAMASRVTLGHSGRSLVADRLTWAALAGVNAAALLRIAGEFPPVAAAWLNGLAALAWLAALVPWVWSYAPMLLRARMDGRPG